MRFSFQVSSLLLLGLLGSSIQAATEDTARPAANEEIIVHGQTVIAAKKKALENKLRRMGYRKFIRKKGRTIVRHELSYRPTMVLDDDGWVHLKRNPIRFEPPGKAADRTSKLKYLWCLPPFTPMCVKIGGQIVSRRRLQGYKGRVASGSRSYVRDWQSAIVSHAMDQRINTDIPNMLDLIWTRGKTHEEDDLFLESIKQRREAILSFWATRTCIKEGDQARSVARDFIIHEVQVSEYPASADEISTANSAQRCLDAPDLPSPTDR